MALDSIPDSDKQFIVVDCEETEFSKSTKGQQRPLKELKEELNKQEADFFQRVVQLKQRLSELEKENKELKARKDQASTELTQWTEQQNLEFSRCLIKLDEEVEMRQSLEKDLQKSRLQLATMQEHQIIFADQFKEEKAKRIQLEHDVALLKGDMKTMESLDDDGLLMMERVMATAVASLQYVKNKRAKNAYLTCKVCMERPFKCALQCGHVFCVTCASKVSECPICRAEIMTRTVCFFS